MRFKAREAQNALFTGAQFGTYSTTDPDGITSHKCGVQVAPSVRIRPRCSACPIQTAAIDRTNKRLLPGVRFEAMLIHNAALQPESPRWGH